ncbi:MAG: hypothetical protein J6U23_10640 [Clostridiales bacterium]|nr:hypothetical protein [Clostridiales bacterium]
MNTLISVFRKSPLLGKICFYFLMFFLAVQNLLYFDYTAYRMIFPLIITLFSLFTGFHVSVFKKEITKKHKLIALVLTVPLLYIFFFFFTGTRNPVFLYRERVKSPLSIVVFIFAMLCDLVLAYWLGLILSFAVCEKFKKRIIRLALLFAALGFMLIMYLPMDSYVANIQNFGFTMHNFFYYYIFFYISLVIILPLTFARLKDKHFDLMYKILFATTIGSFIQYMFMNKHLPYLGLTGEKMVWNIPVLLLNTVIWVAIFVAVFMAPKFLKDKYEKVGNAASLIILSYHLISLILVMVFAPADVYSSKILAYFDPSDQFLLSKNNNVIVFVFDAYDNKDMQDLYMADNHRFDRLKDFTFYTNTTSTFDSTITSINSFCGGCDYDKTYTLDEWLDSGWNSENTTSFYNAMHSAGYKCNAYNFDIPIIEYTEGKFDNVVKYDEPQERRVFFFDLNKFYDDFQELALYRAMPYLVKNLVSLAIDRDAFNFYVTYYDNDQSCYYNDEYIENQNYSTVDDNIFMYNHLFGVHEPCDYELEKDACFVIMYRLLENLESMGLYDSSTIIFMSDHGSHRNDAESVGASPIFMIKEANVTHDSIVFNDAPICLSDFIGTVAVNAGLDNPEQYGSSIYDYAEGDYRERVVYERLFDSSLPTVYATGHLSYMIRYNAFTKYVICGKASDLNGINPFESPTNDKVIDIEIFPMKEYFG